MNDGGPVVGDVHSLVVSVVTNMLILFVIYLSLQIPTGDIIRLYTLFVFIGYFPFEILNTGREICALSGALEHLRLSDQMGYRWFRIVYEFLRGFAQTQYKILAVFMVFLNFFLYKRPIAFGEYFNSSRLMRGFQIGWIIIAILAMLGQLVQHTPTTVGSVEAVVMISLLICLQLVVSIPFIVMIVFYILALSTIISYRRQQALQGISQENQRRQIISILIYCTPPNVMNSPNFFLAFMNSYLSLQTENFPDAWLDFYSTLHVMEKLCVKYRMIVITICTLLAFEQYRKRLALLSRFVKKRLPTTQPFKTPKISTASLTQTVATMVVHDL